MEQMTIKSGIFINTRKANCSIYSSGKMLFDSIKESNTYTLDYVEINDIIVDSLHHGIIESLTTTGVSPVYDFYIINYHHTTMRDVESVNSRRFINLPGKKLCIILEMNRDDPFPYMFPVGFTDFLVLDPTMNRQESNIHAFPRPMPQSRQIKKIESIPELPIIGTYGYAHPGKCFDDVVRAAANEFENAHIRINIPPSTYADAMFGQGFKKQIYDDCKRHEKKGIQVEFTEHYLSDDGLVDWCSENTLNCFFYNRNSPGLAAASDQAIISGAPLAVSGNTTFRHIHKYIKPYPEISLKESILTSQAGIEQMIADWSANMCVSRLEEILSS
jgi:hypothetical protein